MVTHRIISKALCLVIVGLFTTSCGGEPALEEQPRPVRYTQVFLSGGERSRTFSGVSQAGVEARLSFKVAGTVETLPATVGDRVRKGQVLATLDARDYRLKVQNADAALVRAKADARNAAANYERVRQLYENNSASRAELDAGRASSEMGEAGVESSEKQLELARLQLSYTRLTAPTDGAIASVDVEINENVKVGDVVVMLTSGDQPKVEVAMPGVLIAQIRRDDPVSISFDALRGRTFGGAVYEVGVAATGLATTFPVTVRLAGESPEVRPGMAAEVTFELRSYDIRERILVPPFSVGEDRNGRYAFVVEPAEAGFGVTHRRQVTVGEITGDGLEILEGIQDGDLVVTAGVTRIQDGQRVKLPGTEGATQ